MQIVIDIPKEDYDFIQEEEVSNYAITQRLYMAVALGTPLSKCHGRLIDANAFTKEKTKIYCENCDRRKGMSGGKLTNKFVYEIGDAPCRACDVGDMLDYIDDAPTIIEADKSERSNYDTN